MRLVISGIGPSMWTRLEGESAEEIAALNRCVAQNEWTVGRGAEARSRLRALTERLGYPVRVIEEGDPPASPPPRLVVVQRGETALAEGLRALAPPGVPVIWDRRERDRRGSARSIPNDRRRQDRRRLPPAGWSTLRFIVVRTEDSARDRSTGDAS
jgi:hypothetical protein